LALAMDLVARHAQAGQQLRTRLTFWPDAPNALFGDFMRQLAPNDYLRGPKDGWSYFRGRWSEPYEGIRTVDRQRGPFALWTGPSFADGVVETTLLLNPASESASILFRATTSTNEQRGYELVLEPRQQHISLRRHTTNVTTVSTTPFTAIPGGLHVRIEMAGPHLRVWLRPAAELSQTESDQAEPTLEALDPQPILADGYVGVRCSGAPLHLDHFVVQRKEGATWHRESPILEPAEASSPLAATGASEDSAAEQRAWKSFCLLLLNLNEFVYVD
jgi:hypothetical protein